MNKKNTEIENLQNNLRKVRDDLTSINSKYDNILTEKKQNEELQRKRNEEEIKVLFTKINLLDEKLSIFNDNLKENIESVVSSLETNNNFLNNIVNHVENQSNPSDNSELLKQIDDKTNRTLENIQNLNKINDTIEKSDNKIVAVLNNLENIAPDVAIIKDNLVNIGDTLLTINNNVNANITDGVEDIKSHITSNIQNIKLPIASIEKQEIPDFTTGQESLEEDEQLDGHPEERNESKVNALDNATKPLNSNESNINIEIDGNDVDNTTPSIQDIQKGIDDLKDKLEQEEIQEKIVPIQEQAQTQEDEPLQPILPSQEVEQELEKQVLDVTTDDVEKIKNELIAKMGIASILDPVKAQQEEQEKIKREQQEAEMRKQQEKEQQLNSLGQMAAISRNTTSSMQDIQDGIDNLKNLVSLENLEPQEDEQEFNPNIDLENINNS